MREDGIMNYGGSSGGGKKWSVSESVWKRESTGFANALNVCDRKKELTVTPITEVGRNVGESLEGKIGSCL